MHQLAGPVEVGAQVAVVLEKPRVDGRDHQVGGATFAKRLEMRDGRSPRLGVVTEVKACRCLRIVPAVALVEQDQGRVSLADYGDVGAGGDMLPDELADSV